MFSTFSFCFELFHTTERFTSDEICVTVTFFGKNILENRSKTMSICDQNTCPVFIFQTRKVPYHRDSRSLFIYLYFISHSFSINNIHLGIGKVLKSDQFGQFGTELDNIDFWQDSLLFSVIIIAWNTVVSPYFQSYAETVSLQNISTPEN